MGGPACLGRGDPISANLGRISRAGASLAPTIHGPGELIRGLVGATLAVALPGGAQEVQRTKPLTRINL